MKMEMFNEIWKAKFGKDLTESEAWGMVRFIEMIMQNADKNLDEIISNQPTR